MDKHQKMDMNNYFDVLEEVKQKIIETQYKVMSTVNIDRNILYWKIGTVILEYSIWGNKFVKTLAQDLRIEYKNADGYSERNLNYMRQFASRIKEEEFLHRVGAKVSWKAIKALIDKTDTLEEHIWYTNKCIENGWSCTVLIHQIESKLYERQALAIKDTNFKTQLLEPLSEQAEEIIKDFYIFDFLPNSKSLKEKELESALVQNIKELLLEFGSGFAFMAQQYNLKIGNRDFYIDLLFYNAKLHCYFVVELKTVEFEPEFAGKLAFYLSAVDDELKTDSDNPTIGLLLCKEKNKVVAEYSLKDINKPMGVSVYKLLESVSKELEEKLLSIDKTEIRMTKKGKTKKS